MEEILKETKLEVRQVMEILVSLELRGYIREISKIIILLFKMNFPAV